MQKFNIYYKVSLSNMNQKEIADYYCRLSNGEKGRFAAYLSLTLGGAPHTWQQKILRWRRNMLSRPLSPIVQRALTSIIEQEKWRFLN